MRSPKYSIAMLGMVTMLATWKAEAQNLSYGADNFYRSDLVTVEPVTFLNRYQMEIAANIFMPTNITRTPGANNSAIIVGHPNGAVKEQSANLYATKLAEQGFITLAVDISYWGASEGRPRNAVSPDMFAESFSAAVDFLGTNDTIPVDRSRIGALGICGSGGFVISAAKIDSRIKAVATSSMYDMGTVNRAGLESSINITQRQDIIDTASQERWNVLEGGRPDYLAGTPTSVNNDTDPIVLEFYDFYRTPRAEYAPANISRNLTTMRTYADEIKFMNFYPFEDIHTISPRPMLFVSGDQAHSREFSETAFARAGEPKELVWIEGAGHVDLYDRVDLIPFKKFTQFFRESL